MATLATLCYIHRLRANLLKVVCILILRPDCLRMFSWLYAHVLLFWILLCPSRLGLCLEKLCAHGMTCHVKQHIGPWPILHVKYWFVKWYCCDALIERLCLELYNPQHWFMVIPRGERVVTPQSYDTQSFTCLPLPCLLYLLFDLYKAQWSKMKWYGLLLCGIVGVQPRVEVLYVMSLLD